MWKNPKVEQHQVCAPLLLRHADRVQWMPHPQPGLLPRWAQHKASSTPRHRHLTEASPAGAAGLHTSTARFHRLLPRHRQAGPRPTPAPSLHTNAELRGTRPDARNRPQRPTTARLPHGVPPAGGASSGVAPASPPWGEGAGTSRSAGDAASGLAARAAHVGPGGERRGARSVSGTGTGIGIGTGIGMGARATACRCPSSSPARLGPAHPRLCAPPEGQLAAGPAPGAGRREGRRVSVRLPYPRACFAFLPLGFFGGSFPGSTKLWRRWRSSWSGWRFPRAIPASSTAARSPRCSSAARRLPASTGTRFLQSVSLAVQTPAVLKVVCPKNCWRKIGGKGKPVCKKRPKRWLKKLQAGQHHPSPWEKSGSRPSWSPFLGTWRVRWLGRVGGPKVVKGWRVCPVRGGWWEECLWSPSVRSREGFEGSNSSLPIPLRRFRGDGSGCREACVAGGRQTVDIGWHNRGSNWI